MAVEKTRSAFNIVVNGAPMLDLSIPENVKAGESALLDASASFDPEGKELAIFMGLRLV